LIPLTSEAIETLDVKGGKVVVHPIPGLLGGESDEGGERGETDR
jgi:hypothetical protein